MTHKGLKRAPRTNQHRIECQEGKLWFKFDSNDTEIAEDVNVAIGKNYRIYVK